MQKNYRKGQTVIVSSGEYKGQNGIVSQLLYATVVVRMPDGKLIELKFNAIKPVNSESKA